MRDLTFEEAKNMIGKVVVTKVDFIQIHGKNIPSGTKVIIQQVLEHQTGNYIFVEWPDGVSLDFGGWLPSRFQIPDDQEEITQKFKKIDHFPDTCRCGSPAYIGFTNVVDCSNKNCPYK